MPGSVFNCLSVDSSRQRSRARHGIQLLGSGPGSRPHISTWPGIHLLVCEPKLRGDVAEPGTVLTCLAVNQAQGNMSVPGKVFSSHGVPFVPRDGWSGPEWVFQSQGVFHVRRNG